MTLFGVALLPTVLIATAVMLAILSLVRPAIPVRWALTLFVRVFYRMRVIGQENIPAEGPALLVCNHVSYIDWILLLVAQRRVIRFVVFAGWTKTFFIRHLLRWGKVIPIDASSGPRAIVKSLQAAGDALSRGNLVCIFAEGRFTRTGFLLPFRRGFEEIAKRGGAPIIPVCLDELWGSIFSFYGDRCLWKLPRQLPYSVTVAFGKPMPAESSAEQVRLAVQQLAADAAIARSDELLPVHRQFVRVAARRPRKVRAVTTAFKLDEQASSDKKEKVDFVGPASFCSDVLARSMRLAWQLRTKIGAESVVGIWIPPSADAMIANVAVAFIGKASVNLQDDLSTDIFPSIVNKLKLRYVLVSQKVRAAQPSSLQGVELIDMESLLRAAPRWHKPAAFLAAICLPGFVLDRFLLRLDRHHLDDPATIFLIRHDSDTNLQAIVHTHRSLAAAASSLIKTYDLSRRGGISAGFPLSHCVGNSLSFWTPLSIGLVVAYFYQSTPAPSDDDTKVENDRRAVALKHEIGPGQLLHFMSSVDFRTKTPTNDGSLPLEAYYCPELATIVATNVPDKTLEGFTQIGNKPGTVGQPLAGMAARIVNPETFEPLPAGQEGLLQFRSASLMKGYLTESGIEEPKLHNGWFSTGDFARIDEQGFITIVA